MYLIVGLGNPEEEYSNTRHNMGFDTINEFAKKNDIEINKTKFQALYGSGFIHNQKVILVKPQTYMNLSGQAVKQFMDFYKIDIEKLLIIYDDMDIEPGKIKIRKKGSAGGHNGVKSIIQNIGTQEFSRIRIGIGRPKEEFDKIDYVIGNLSKEEYSVLESGIKKATDAIESFLQEEVDVVMNKFN